MMFGGAKPRNKRNPFIAPLHAWEPHQQVQQGQFNQQAPHPENYSHAMRSEPHLQQQPQQSQQQQRQKNNKVMSYFMREDGSLDYEKIGNGVQQVYGIAGKFGPMMKNLSPLLSSILKK